MDKELKERYFRLVDEMKALVDDIDKQINHIKNMDHLSLSFRKMLLNTLDKIDKTCRIDVVKLSMIYYPNQLTELTLKVSGGTDTYIHDLEKYEEELNYFSEKMQTLNILLLRLPS